MVLGYKLYIRHRMHQYGESPGNGSRERTTAVCSFNCKVIRGGFITHFNPWLPAEFIRVFPWSYGSSLSRNIIRNKSRPGKVGYPTQVSRIRDSRWLKIRIL